MAPLGLAEGKNGFGSRLCTKHGDDLPRQARDKCKKLRDTDWEQQQLLLNRKAVFVRTVAVLECPLGAVPAAAVGPGQIIAAASPEAAAIPPPDRHKPSPRPVRARGRHIDQHIHS